MQFFSVLTTAMILVAAAATAAGQPFSRSFQVDAGARVEVVNKFGRVLINATPSAADSPDAAELSAFSASGISASDLKTTSSRSNIQIEIAPEDKKKRIDVQLIVPAGVRLKVETVEGEVRIGGDIASAEVRTETGTIAADVPTENVRYSLLWTASKPRFLSDFELKNVKERSAGKFEIKGTYSDQDDPPASPSAITGDSPSEQGTSGLPNGDGDTEGSDDEKKPKKKSSAVKLDLETARGIILLNIPPNEVSSDLRERPLTNAAKAIIRSGDSLLMEAIRRAAPKYYGDYTRTLPPLKFEPTFADAAKADISSASSVKVASVRVSDIENRSLGSLSADDFEVLESGEKREIISVRPASAPFNLVLLLDVSGSVDNYVTFIRKAARSFVNTVDSRDRVALVTFNDDVNVVAKFTTDKAQLSASLDTFDAGGATAYYDALAYTLADTLRPLKGERTAIVILTDGDDNRSFLPFDSMLSSIQESGALIYPLYVPSGLIAAELSNPSAPVDSLRSRYLQGELTSKAKDEGERLAKASGGVYYEITKLTQIQAAYEDIVRQLRTAYEIEYRSQLAGADTGISPRLRIRTRQPNTYVQIRSVDRR